MSLSRVGQVLAPLGFLVVTMAVVTLIAVSGALPQDDDSVRGMPTITTVVTIEVPVGQLEGGGPTYRVQEGDTWDAISGRVGVSAQRLKAYNGIEGGGADAGLRPGLVLRVPAQ